jgi:triacylglycerol esterase/lipase EstA (alpha/beta hydrolase family)
MSRTSWILLLSSTGLLLAGHAAASSPPLESDPAELDRAVRCPVAFSGAHEPVLLVHGTAGRPEDHWALGYQKILPDLGYDVCTVRLPDFALGDIQVATEYVVHAVRSMAAASGRDVDIVGYSQGSLEPRWAVRYWHDVRAVVDDIVTLAGPHHGTAVADASCAGGSCDIAVWQMKQDSAFITTLNSIAETLEGIDYTSIYSLNDELVQPSAPVATAELDGATNILVQDVCPGRVVAHSAEPVDAAVFALVLDALSSPGAADPARFDPTSCDATYMPGLTADDGTIAQAVIYGNGGETLGDHPDTSAEPELAWYALSEPSQAVGLVAAAMALSHLARRRRD